MNLFYFIFFLHDNISYFSLVELIVFEPFMDDNSDWLHEIDKVVDACIQKEKEPKC